MSERNPFRTPAATAASSNNANARLMDGALVTDARLSQLFDPIARLVDAYPEQRRNGPYHHHHHHQGPPARNSTEYTHLTAYPAIIEPATYDDGSASRYNRILCYFFL